MSSPLANATALRTIASSLWTPGTPSMNALWVLKQVVEPGGAVSLAAVLAGRIETRDRTTAVILSGGNVDPALFAAIIEDRFTPIP